MDKTLKYIRSDTRGRADSSGDDLRMGGCMVALDGAPDPERVRAVLLGVVCDRGVGLKGGRMGAVEGPQRFRDQFWRLAAPPGVARGSVLDAGDLVSAERTNETHARLAEVVDVLHARFPTARLVVVGGGHDHAYGEVLGLARWVRKADEDSRLAMLCVDAQINAQRHEGEAHSGTPLRRLLTEPASRLEGESLAVWGLQRAHVSKPLVDFLRKQGARSLYWDEIKRGEDAASRQLLTLLRELAKGRAGVSMSIDLGAFAQEVAPGVSEPVPVGVGIAPVLRAAAALGELKCTTQLGIYELNPRHDRDGATARLAARLAWSYVTGLL